MKVGMNMKKHEKTVAQIVEDKINHFNSISNIFLIV